MTLLLAVSMSMATGDPILGLDQDLFQGILVAALTFVVGPIILFILAWLKEAINTEKKKDEELKTKINASVDERIKVIADTLEAKIENFMKESRQDRSRLQDDIHRVEDILMGRNYGERFRLHEHDRDRNS